MEYKSIEEERARIDGFEIPIQCILINSPKSRDIDIIHYHDYVEVLYGIDCDAKIWYNGKNYTLKNGDLVIINSKKPHAVISNINSSKYLVIKFLPQILYAAEQSVFEFKYIIPFITDNDKFKCVFFKREIENTEIAEIMHTLSEEWDKREYGYEIALRIQVIKLALWLIRYWYSASGNNSFEITEENQNIIRLIQRAMEYAQNNFSTATTLEAAELCGLSYSYFSRIFKRIMKKSFTEYINYIRITESQRLLVSTNKSITEIAMDTGFSTTSYYIERFKDMVHMTPKHFRKNYKAE